MRRSSIVAILACCVLAFALAACSGGSAKSMAADDLKGFWELDPDCPMGFEAAISLDEEDYAEAIIGESFLEGTWSADGSTAKIDFEDGVSVNLYVSDGKLVMGQDDGSKLVFVASDMDEYYAKQEQAEDEEGDDDLEAEGLEGLEMVDEVIEDIDAVAIANDDVCVIEVNGKGTDYTGDPCYRLSITNNTKGVIFIVPNDDFTVDGAAIEAGLGETVDPGETIEAEMYFASDDLGGGLEKLVNVKGVIFVGDDDSGSQLGTYDFQMD